MSDLFACLNNGQRNSQRELTMLYRDGVEVALKGLECCLQHVDSDDRLPPLHKTQPDKVVAEEGGPISEPHPKGVGLYIQNCKARFPEHARDGIDRAAMADMVLEDQQFPEGLEHQ